LVTQQAFHANADDVSFTGLGATYFWVGTTSSNVTSFSALIGDSSASFILSTGTGLAFNTGTAGLLQTNTFLPANTFCVIVATVSPSGDYKVFTNGALWLSGSAPTMENDYCGGLYLGNFGLGFQMSSPADHQMAGKYVGNVWSQDQVKSFSANPWQIFQPKQSVSYITNPSANLYSTLDEASVDDADYITTSTASTCELALDAVADPATSTGQVVTIRAKSVAGSTLVATLKQPGVPGYAGGLFLPRRWRAQPQVPVEVDWNNSITAGMVFAYLPGFGADLVGRNGRAVIKGAGTKPLGPDIHTTGTVGDSGLRIHDTVPLLGGLLNSTVVAVARTNAGVINAPGSEADGRISNNGNALYSERGSSGASIYKLGASYRATGLTLAGEFTYRSAASVLGQVFRNDTTINDGVASFYAGVRFGANIAVAVNLSITSQAYAGGTDFGAVQRRIGSDAGDVTATWNGTISLCAGWSRNLSVSELNALYFNPWQIFKPRKHISYFGGPSTPGTIATRTFTSLGSSFADYQMTLTTPECDAITDYNNLSITLEAQ
jgi:hypothetical protein